MDLGFLLEVCEAYASLGTAVQEQLQDIAEAAAEGKSYDDVDVNMNAVDLIEDRFLRKLRWTGDDELETDMDNVRELIGRMKEEE